MSTDTNLGRCRVVCRRGLLGMAQASFRLDDGPAAPTVAWVRAHPLLLRLHFEVAPAELPKNAMLDLLPTTSKNYARVFKAEFVSRDGQEAVYRCGEDRRRKPGLRFVDFTRGLAGKAALPA